MVVNCRVRVNKRVLDWSREFEPDPSSYMACADLQDDDYAAW